MVQELFGKVQAFFKAQLDQYMDWLDRRGLSKNALVDVREEMLDHETYVEMETAHPQWLPVARFKRKMEISDADWDASQPRATIELRKGRRDMLNPHREPEQRGPDELRRKMRMQAIEKRAFLEQWTKRNRNYRNMMREHREKRYCEVPLVS